MLTDHEDGRVYEYSESCKEILKLNNNKKNSYESNEKFVDDFITDFKFKDLASTRAERYLTKEIYEGVH